MDTDHLLTDVFELALDKLKADRKDAHSPQDLTRALGAAEKEIIEERTRFMQGTIRSERRALVKMLEEWDKTRKPVRTMWSADRWKA